MGLNLIVVRLFDINSEKIDILLRFLTCKASEVVFTGNANTGSEALAGALDLQITR